MQMKILFKLIFRCLKMESLNKINTLYKIAHLMDGDFDGKQLHFNKTRHYLSCLVECLNYFFALTHFYVFIYHDRKYDLVYYKVHDGLGDRIVNFAIGWTIFSYALIIRVHRQFTKHPERLQLISFLWCFDEIEMQERFSLDQKSAKKQIRAQCQGKRYAIIWHRYFFASMAGYIIKFAVENPTFRIEYGVWFYLKLVLYFALFLAQQSSLLRTFLIFDELNLSCTYLANYLETLIRRLQSVAYPNARQSLLSRQISKTLSDYNDIIRMQRQLNAHFEQTFYGYWVFGFFTVLYPVIILFETNPPLIASNSLNYLVILFLIIFPPFFFNSRYLVASNTKFLKSCFHLVPLVKKGPKLKLKLLNVSQLNPSEHSISFNFHHLMYFSMWLFILWVIESLSLILMAYRVAITI